MLRMHSISLCVSLATLLALNLSARGAGDRLAITQDMMPLVIVEPGRYVVTEDLEIEEREKHGITIACNHVEIDFQKHTLRGPGKDSAAGVYQEEQYSHLTMSNAIITQWQGESAEDASYGFAVYTLGASNYMVWVDTKTNRHGIMNGSDAYLRRCRARASGDGLQAGPRCILDFCTMVGNSGTGIRMANGSSADRCTIYSNEVGMVTEENTKAVFCTAYGNRQSGIQALAGSSILNCSSYDNNVGVAAEHNVRVEKTSANSNGSVGIQAGEDCVIISSTTIGNDDVGIRAASRCTIQWNKSHENGDAGIVIEGNDASVTDNTMWRNRRALVVRGHGNLIARNHAQGNLVTSYDISGTNRVSSILSQQEADISAAGDANIQN